MDSFRDEWVVGPWNTTFNKMSLQLDASNRPVVAWGLTIIGVAFLVIGVVLLLTLIGVEYTAELPVSRTTAGSIMTFLGFAVAVAWIYGKMNMVKQPPLPAMPSTAW